jgi:hypothetical protein
MSKSAGLGNDEVNMTVMMTALISMAATIATMVQTRRRRMTMIFIAA